MSGLRMIEILAVVGGLGLLGGCIEPLGLYERAGFCGNGGLDRGEECDDGNVLSGDGCSAACRRELAAGGAHTCVVLDAERVQCWGLGASGQLGRVSTATIGDDEPGLPHVIDIGGKVRQVVAGEAHTCALMEAGAVRCWGYGSHGQLGLGNTESIGDDEVPSSVEPVDVGGRVMQLAAGREHTCALMEMGTVRCWGSSSVGQLGYGNRSSIGDDEAPWSAGEVAVGGRVIQLAASHRHMCALLEMGTVRCWGSGSHGQLGYGDSENIGDDEAPSSAGDVVVGGRVTQLAAGSDHTCALMETGAVRCWGNGDGGRLGYGDEKDVGDDEDPSSAGDVEIGGHVIQLVAGDGHTCALMEMGTVRCWGHGSHGQLGYGRTESIGDDEVPSSAGDVAVDGRVIQLVAGRFHTCALLEMGEIRCWGSGEHGQLGYGDRDSIGDDETPSVAGPVPVGGRVSQLAAGHFHTCALLEVGTVRCWGSGSNGKLGYGSTVNIGDDEEPSSAGDVAIGGRVIHLAAGRDHTCALMETGTVRCWGSGSAGKLGYSSTTAVGDDETPGARFGLEIGGVITQVATGRAHTCALRRAGAVHCWGDGGSGQLGLGRQVTIEATGAASLQVGDAVKQLAAGDLHTCALLQSGAVVCWGASDSDQLGHGYSTTIGDNEHPGAAGAVELGGEAVQVQAGARHTCALLEPGSIRCWGANEYGQLGQPSTMRPGDDESSIMAGEVFVGGSVQQMATGGFHTCALLDSGEVRCWGRNDSGQLGIASVETVGDDEQPGEMPAVELAAQPGDRVIQLSAGDAHTCALMATGGVRCWGSGEDGRLGYGDTRTIGDDEHPGSAGDVELGSRAIAIAAGAAHTCAMLEGGAIACWGSGSDGRLGHGNLESVGDDETPATAGPVPGQ